MKVGFFILVLLAGIGYGTYAFSDYLTNKRVQEEAIPMQSFCQGRAVEANNIRKQRYEAQYNAEIHDTKLKKQWETAIKSNGQLPEHNVVVIALNDGSEKRFIMPIGYTIDWRNGSFFEEKSIPGESHSSGDIHGDMGFFLGIGGGDLNGHYKHDSRETYNAPNQDGAILTLRNCYTEQGAFLKEMTVRHIKDYQIIRGN